MMKRWTIRARLILAYTLLFGVTLFLFAAVFYAAVKDQRFSTLNDNLENHVEKLHSEIEEQSENARVHREMFPSVEDLHAIKTRGLEDERFQLFDTAWTVVVTDSLLSANEGIFPASALSGKTIWDMMNIKGIHYTVVWVPIEVNETIRYILQVAVPTTEIDTDMARLRLLLIIAVPFVLFLGGMIAAWITRSAFRPVTSMIATADRITGTNIRERIPEPLARDEIQLLAKTLNSMIARLDAAFESQRQFVADASHELRTPLTVIRSELEFAQRSTNDTSARESLRISLAEIDHLTLMAESLLILARMDASQFRLSIQPVRLDELLVECVQLMRSAAERNGVTLDLHIESAVEITGDGARLKSVVLNLLDNAVKFSPRGGLVRCSLSISGSGTVTISVSDDGPGISESETPSIFKRFYQTETARSGGNGSGLGLAIVDNIVRYHGGTVTIQSTPGSGSTFTVQLPRQAPPTQ